ncbi:response regulator [Pontibacillus litoralis]|uniref:Response regulatory domain-containing protein n=1 Tax=Pontibacillus litoralis JSM 072002 TaxID=1385512 RepID=A0A0A5FVA6_9BACI|nr:response regulator [Pontibacillus litoralis]KGX84726.1 hypothetical protein N784_11985 [Pontibacillus litoralis JSM 072002]
MRAILVDDEKLALDYLKALIKKISAIEVIETCNNAIVAKEVIVQQEVDVVFLDITLPGKDGMQLAKEILQEKPELSIVFVTAHDSYAVKAYELNALDYLLKPIKIDRLKLTVERLKKKANLKLNNNMATNSELLRINVLGSFSFELDGGEREIILWRTKKTQELFLYLLFNRNQLVRKSTLIELLWPDIELGKANALLYTTVYNVRKNISMYKNHFMLLQSTLEGYVLDTENVVLDVDEWREKVSELPKLIESTVNQYEEAMNLYTGAYLQDYDYLWTEGERYKYEQQWLAVALQIAAFYVKQGKIKEAKQWYTRICADAPLVEEAYFALMKIFAAEKDHVSVHRQYQILENVLHEELDVAPSDEVQKWYLHWCTSTNDRNLQNAPQR